MVVCIHGITVGHTFTCVCEEVHTMVTACGTEKVLYSSAVVAILVYHFKEFYNAFVSWFYPITVKIFYWLFLPIVNKW